MRTKILLAFLIFCSPALAQNVSSSGMYPGMIFPFAGSNCPPGSLDANGASLLRAGKYAPLFAAISTLYGFADGTHFNIPNTQGLFLRSAGSQTVGGLPYSATLAAKSTDTTKKNGLSIIDGTHSHTISEVGIGNGSSAGPAYGGNGATGYSNSTNNSSSNTSLSGGDAETAPASLAVKYCIKY